MRFFAKLFLLILITIGFQRLFETYIDQIDEGVFVARVFTYRLLGNTDDEPLIAASDRLIARQGDRYVKKLSVTRAEIDS